MPTTCYFTNRKVFTRTAFLSTIKLTVVSKSPQQNYQIESLDSNVKC